MTRPEADRTDQTDQTDRTGEADAGTSGTTEAPPPPLLELRDGLTEVVDTPEALAAYCAALAAGTGPVAIDAERASGYRYSSRAYLVQLRREGAGTALVDPIAFDDLAPLQEAIGETEWILHAATQDLACLAEVGLRPARLFDTELAGRLLGHPKVGLATLVETVLGRRLRKEHSAVDWSTRPLPVPWLEYAALDVEVLVELRSALGAELEEAGKTEWARQEFESLLRFEPNVRAEPWRRVGTHKLRGRRALGAVRALWETRDDIARSRDVSPGRVLPEAAIVAAAEAMPTTRAALLSTPGFKGRGADRYASRWLAAITTALELPDAELPARSPRGDGPPPPRAWADKDPVAARRLVLAREAVAQRAAELRLPTENLLTPDYLRRVLWTPPVERAPQPLAAGVAERLRDLGARPWQVDIVTPIVVEAVLAADVEPADEAPGDPDV
ncbi:HRDC domain-containing protein [Nocardioides zeae]|uniref:HRDC domain-containing protein n=1 Tax=Nocardioides imazamoxiresistens TaxID=3231893 RepID=A0ABU3PXG6_9ACTN|nr:HRDC domain-containing protein [Nocardioides zeae]MDT9593938.1 HRDC domain-containing protein [Nocardioides zeae]